MKKRLPQNCLLVLLLLPLLGRAQEVRISGRVVDAKTKEPVPFVSLSLLKRGVGTLTDERGQFELNDPISPGGDSLVVATQGYEPYSVPVKAGITADLVIEMVRRLPSTDNANLKHRVAMPDEEFFPVFSQYAFFVPNDKQKRFGKMRSVSFYLGMKGFPHEIFRVRIYSVNPLDKMPSNDLLFEDITVKPENGTGWCALNLNSFNIELPESGCYIAVEYIIEYRRITLCEENYTPVGRILHPLPSPVYNTYGYITENKKWKLCQPAVNFQRFGQMIKLEMNAIE